MLDARTRIALRSMRASYGEAVARLERGERSVSLFAQAGIHWGPRLALDGLAELAKKAPRDNCSRCRPAWPCALVPDLRSVSPPDRAGKRADRAATPARRLVRFLAFQANA